MIDELTSYAPAAHASDPRYTPQTRYLGPDFRVVAAKERAEHAGSVTRIDFATVDGQLVWRGWRAGWVPGEHPAFAKPVEAGKTLDQALANLRAAGWTVFQWPGGARAFRCGPRPVRTGEHLRRFRERMTANPPAGVTVTGRELLYEL